MSSDFATALDECLRRFNAGESVSACLERYPEYAKDLEPLLETAQFVEVLRFTESPRPHALAQGRQRFLAEGARLRQRQQTTGPSLLEMVRDFFAPVGAGPVWVRGAAVMLAVLLLFATVSGVAVQASETSLPGDALYSVKQVARQVQLLTTFSPEARERKREEIQAEERAEVRQAVEQGRVFEEDVAGVIVEWEGSSLVLEGGLHISVADTTEIQGPQAVGHIAEIRVRSEDGRLIAQQVAVREVAVAMATPTDTATITPSATVEPTATVRPTRTPEPTKQPTQTPTSTRRPTHTPTVRPKVTPTLLPTATEVFGVSPHVFELRGPIESISASVWIVAGQQIQIVSSTVIKGEPAIGRVAHVQANRREDGSFEAITIEVETPPAAPTPSKISISGVVESKESAEIWIINGRRVRVNEQTEIIGDLRIGAFVDVEGEESGSTIRAKKITVRRACEQMVFLEGVIRSIDSDTGTWIVGDEAQTVSYTVVVGSDASIEGEPSVGAMAQIEACRTEDGSFLAQRIFILPPTPMPETPTPLPTFTVESEPTLTPSPEPRESVTPTATGEVSSAPTPTVTLEPSPGVTAEPSPTATNSPTPSTPTPTATEMSLPSEATIGPSATVTSSASGGPVATATPLSP